MRTIDGDALKRRAQKAATEAWKMKIEAKVETILNQFIDWINEAPTIQPEPKMGRWIYKNDLITVPGGYWECSECKEGRLLYEANFCPNCGADMRGEQDDSF